MLNKKTYIWIVLLVIATFVCKPTEAQQLQYNFRHLTPNEGLSNENVNAILQDHYGFIWIGTSYGLNRFDGVNQKQYFHNRKDSTTISGNFIMALHEDRKHNIWIGSMQGLSMFQQTSQKVTRYLPAYRVLKIQENSAGQIWVATSSGLKSANPIEKKLTDVQVADTALNRLLQNEITDLLCTKDNLLYIAGHFGVVILNWQSKQWQLINNQSENGSLIESNVVERIAVDSSNKLWIATGEVYSMLYCIGADRKTSTALEHITNLKEKLITNRIRGLMVDASNNLWVASNDFGLAMCPPDKNTITTYTNNPLQPGSLANNQCTGAMLIDKSGIIWVGISGYGVDYFHPWRILFSNIERDPFTKSTLLSNWGRALAEDAQKNFWFATGSGVSFYDQQKGSFKNINSKDLQSPSVRSILLDDNKYVWIGTASGLSKYNIKTGAIRSYSAEDGIPNIFVHTLYKTSVGKIFAGGNRGLYEYIPGTDKFYNHINNPVLAEVADNVVKSIYEDKLGNWWFGTHANGVYVFNTTTQKIIKRINAETSSPLSDNAIQTIVEDTKGNMWLGTGNGLNCYNIASGKNTIYGIADGLPNIFISGLQVDRIGRIWVGTGNGLCVINAVGKVFKQFDLSDGLPTKQFNDQRAYTLSDGRFVFPSRKGFVLFNPDDFNWEEENPNVYLMDVNILGSEKPPLVNAQELKTIKLNHEENFFNIQLRALNYLNPKQCWYSYKLDGFDKDWIVTKDPIATYTNVPPGNYTFRYKATNNRNLWSGVEKSLSIKIDNVFYNTWWFKAVLLLLLLSGIVAFYKHRISQKDALQDLKSKAQLLEKEKAVVMYESLKQHLNPHFLFNSLTSLGSLIRFDQKMAGDFLDKMSKVYRYILKNRDNETVTLGEELKAIEMYIQLQKTRFENGLLVNTTIADEYYYRKLPPVTLQNLVENAIKHNTTGPDSPLVIDIFIDDDYLVVRNNLQKKGYVESSNKQGLANMASLFQYMSNRPMQILETETHFTVKIPLL